MDTDFDVIILGAGASGLMAAITAGKRKKKVLLIDHADNAGRKMLASGGGKCNITNKSISTDDYFGENSDFCKSALRRFTTRNVVEMLEHADIQTEEREFGRIFCQRSAKDIVLYLEEEAKYFGAKFLFGENNVNISFKDNYYEIETKKNIFSAKSLLVATGGLAYPQLGASDLGLKIAKQFGHKIIPPTPALTGFILPNDSPLLGLQGMSLPAQARLRGMNTANEALLFTHKGISGPCMYQISCVWQRGDSIEINFLPEENIEIQMHKSENGKLLVKNLLAHFLPVRLVQAILTPELANRKTAELSKKERKLIVDSVHHYNITPQTTEGFSRAETTKGGVDTTQINPKTMESLLCPNLFFSGEVVDIAGRLGGYNIHWAFASGYAAANAF